MDNFFRFESQSDFSLSGFDCETFELLVCSNFADCPPLIDYPTFWLSDITSALSAKCQKKRKRRQTLPFFYSPITVHCLNKLESARRRRASFSALLRLEKEVSDFIELDKACFLDSCKHFATNEAFKILRRLNGRSTLPKETFWRDSHASTITEKANLLNKYFQSVLIESTCSAGTLPQMANPVALLSEVTFSVNQVTKLLKIVPSSTNVACDGIPSFVWNSCPSTLAGYVCSLFSYIINTNEWPNFLNCAYVTTIFKKGSKSDVENYRPIFILPRLFLLYWKKSFLITYIAFFAHS